MQQALSEGIFHFGDILKCHGIYPLIQDTTTTTICLFLIVLSLHFPVSYSLHMHAFRLMFSAFCLLKSFHCNRQSSFICVHDLPCFHDVLFQSSSLGASFSVGGVAGMKYNQRHALWSISVWFSCIKVESTVIKIVTYRNIALKLGAKYGGCDFIPCLDEGRYDAPPPQRQHQHAWLPQRIAER